MKYISVTIKTTSQACELLADELGQVTGGCQVDDPNTVLELESQTVRRWDYIESELFENLTRCPTVTFFVPDDEQGKQIEKQALELLSQLKQSDQGGFYGDLSTSRQVGDSVDWENNWKSFFHQFEVGEGLLICPSWEKPSNEQGRAVLTIDPAQAFGTGTHATTSMCLSWLDKNRPQGKTLLDMGCGSGILGCAALLLGAKHVLACDVQPDAARITVENMEKNDIAADRYEVQLGDIIGCETAFSAVMQHAPFDLIIANIVSDVLMAMADKLKLMLTHDGQLLLSGVIDSREQEVRRHFIDCGFEHIGSSFDDGWACIELRVS